MKDTKRELSRLSRKSDKLKSPGLIEIVFDLALLAVTIAVAVEILRWTLLWASAK